MPASIGVNMRVTGHYSQGGRLHMEDKFSVAYQQTEDERDLEYAYFGIFDGHGGAEAAAYAKDHLMEAIVRQKHFWSDDDADVLRAIRNGYMMTHMNMWKELEKWPKVIYGLPSTAGTTASVAFIRRGKIYIGHVGDSAIVLGYQVDGKEEWCAKPLTRDHKPESEVEMQRIKSSGGKVVPKAGVHRVVWNRHVFNPEFGKPRREEIPFLAIARSLGDHWSYNMTTDEFVVSPDPDVGVISIDPAKFRCLIFGTDGLWNMISPKMAVHLVQQAQKHNEKAALGACFQGSWINPSKILVDSAIERWANTKIRADNTSVVTVMMDPPGPPRNRAPNPLPKSNIKSQDTEKNEPTLHYPVERTTEKVKNEASSDQSTSSKSETESASVSSPVTPLPPMSNLQHFAKTPQINLPAPQLRRVFNNYGNPAESYFIARLLNKTQIKNSLQHVYEEIMRTNEVQEQKREEFTNNNNNNNNVNKPVENKPQITSPELETPPEKSIDSSADAPAKKETEEEKSAELVNDDVKEKEEEEAAKSEQESIQINEVSSSSPIISPPKPRKRKSKGVSKSGNVAPQLPVRNLRSNDNSQLISLRPQTRHASDKNRVGAESNVQKKNCEPKVPVPVHFLKSNTQSSRISLIQTKQKLSTNSHIALKQSASLKTDNKKVVEKKLIKLTKTTVSVKQTEKLDVKVKSVPVKSNENSSIGRITRSKEVQSPSVEQVANEPKKSQSNQSIAKLGTDDSETKACSRTNVKQKSSENGSESFFTNKTVVTVTTRRNRDQNLGSNSECCKENMLTPICPSPGLIPLNSLKRRNSGEGTCDSEPKKRRTRLGDKNNVKSEDQHEDVTSTESIKETSTLLELSTCSDHNCEEVTEKLNVRFSKKITKCLNKNSSVVTNEISNEVHSTTLHIENECSTRSKVNNNNNSNNGNGNLTVRALRPRHDTATPTPTPTPTPTTDKKSNVKCEKRLLRSNNAPSELTMTTSKLTDRPILRSRNSVGTLPSKNTPRRRVPWPQNLRHNLRKRFSK